MQRLVRTDRELTDEEGGGLGQDLCHDISAAGYRRRRKGRLGRASIANLSGHRKSCVCNGRVL